MSCKQQVYSGDFGTEFFAVIKDGDSALDLSGGASVVAIFKPPANGTAFERDASIVDEAKGRIRYTSVEGEFVTVGVWKWRARATVGGGQFRSTWASFEVLATGE